MRSLIVILFVMSVTVFDGDNKPETLSFAARYPQCDNESVVQLDLLNAKLVETRDFKTRGAEIDINCQSKMCKKITTQLNKLKGWYLQDYALDPALPSRLTISSMQDQAAENVIAATALALQQGLIDSGLFEKSKNPLPVKVGITEKFPCYADTGVLKEGPDPQPPPTRSPQVRPERVSESKAEETIVEETGGLKSKFEPIQVTRRALAAPFNQMLTKAQVIQNHPQYQAPIYVMQILIGVPGAKGVWGPLTDQYLIPYQTRCSSRMSKPIQNGLMLDAVTRSCLTADYSARFGTKTVEQVFEERVTK